MTVPHHVPARPVASLADAARILRECGLRLSTSRRLVLQALLDADRPVSAEQIARSLTLDIASVHRNFETLERHGLVRHVHLGHGPGLYALLGYGEREYIYCDRCGAVQACTPKELDPIRTRVRELYGYEARFSHFPIVGLCPGCAAKERGAAPRRARRRSAAR